MQIRHRALPETAIIACNNRLVLTAIACKTVNPDLSDCRFSISLACSRSSCRMRTSGAALEPCVQSKAIRNKPDIDWAEGLKFMVIGTII